MRLGPFPVTEKDGNVSYQLEIPPHYRLHYTFHVSQLKPAYDNHAGQAPPPPMEIEGEDEFEIETILQHRPAKKSQGDKNIRFVSNGKVMALSTTRRSQEKA